MLGLQPFKRFPAMTWKPMAPFFFAGCVVFYGINSAADAMMQSDEWKNHPRNPKATAPAKEGH